MQLQAITVIVTMKSDEHAKGACKRLVASSCNFTKREIFEGGDERCVIKGIISDEEWRTVAEATKKSAAIEKLRAEANSGGAFSAPATLLTSRCRGAFLALIQS